MRTRLKVCGITNREDAEGIITLGVDILGFNFYPASPRYISPENAANIIQYLPPSVTTVGILVAPTPALARQILLRSGVQWLQVYHPKRLDYLLELGVPVIYAHRMAPNTPIPWPINTHYLLLDAYHKIHLGGTGQRFQWEQIPAEIPRSQLVLAGGINPQNIHQALQQVNPAIIDVASGSEIEPGRKDMRKIQIMQEAILMYNLSKLKSVIIQ